VIRVSPIRRSASLGVPTRAPASTARTATNRCSIFDKTTSAKSPLAESRRPTKRRTHSCRTGRCRRSAGGRLSHITRRGDIGTIPALPNLALIDQGPRYGRIAASRSSGSPTLSSISWRAAFPRHSSRSTPARMCPRRAPACPTPTVASRRQPRSVGQSSSLRRHQSSTTIKSRDYLVLRCSGIPTYASGRVNVLTVIRCGTGALHQRPGGVR
jgi:hypothetical protein